MTMKTAKIGFKFWLLWAVTILMGTQLACSTAGIFSREKQTKTAAPTATETITVTYSPTAKPYTSTPTRTPTLQLTSTNTATPTATPIPSATPTPRHTPTPLGYLYYDNFSLDTGVWAVGGTDELTVLVEDGRLKMSVEATMYIAWTDSFDIYDDFEMQIIAYPQASQVDYNYGFIFREQDEKTFYLARVTLLGQYALYRFVDGQKTTLVPWSRSPIITTDKNTLKLICLGPRIVFSVSDTVLFDIQDESIAKGRLGFYVGTGKAAEVQVQFDDLSLFQPQESALPEATPTPQYTWADYLYFDLTTSQANYLKVKGWYSSLEQGQSVSCRDVKWYAVKRPQYVIPSSLGTLRSIYDRYIETINLVHRIDDQIAPLNRLKLICDQGVSSIAQIGQQDMTHDKQKLAQAETNFSNLILEIQRYR